MIVVFEGRLSVFVGRRVLEDFENSHMEIFCIRERFYGCLWVSSGLGTTGLMDRFLSKRGRSRFSVYVLVGQEQE